MERQFLEREIDLSKSICLKLVRIAALLQREAALELGMDKAMAGITAFDGALEAPPGGIAVPANIPSAPKVALPMKPPSACETGRMRAPNERISATRSWLIQSGMKICTSCPRARPIAAKAMPVLPLVASAMTSPARMVPSR